jgi:hypothetical protein
MDRSRRLGFHFFKESACMDKTSNPRIQNWDEKGQDEVSPPESCAGTSRRAFLGQIRGAAAATLATSAVELGPLTRPARGEERTRGGEERARECFEVRERAAEQEREAPIPHQVPNGDEKRYRNFIGNYSKGLPHNSIGEVDRDAYEQLLDAAGDGTAAAFEGVPLGGTVKLVNPMAGLAFDLEGTDSHQLAIGPPPAVASQTRADDMVELYWMVLCREVNFTDYGSDLTAQAASAELSSLAAFAGPRSGGGVTAQSLFRGFTADDVIGPYVSQFLLKPFNYGQIPISGQITTYLPRIDYLTTPAAWLAARNGQGPFAKNQNDPHLRYIRNGRDLSAYVHTDQVFEAFYNAGIWLFTHGAPPNPGNPYLGLAKQSSFATFGGPHFLTLLAEAANRALKAVWYAKWFVHRTLRPEDYGGLVHLHKSGQASYPLHTDVLNSDALARTRAQYGSFLFAQAYPEGCPQHPSYAQGHGSVAGACATILKVAIDGDVQFNTLTGGSIQTASEDGLSLVPYAGSDANEISVNGEINKLASNIGVGRNHAGVHWRTDYSDSLKLGEAIALSILKDQKEVYGETFSGFRITKFDGTTVAA